MVKNLINNINLMIQYNLIEILPKKVYDVAFIQNVHVHSQK
jgi:hypothetical protein